MADTNSISEAIRASIERAIPGAQVEVTDGGGAHYSLVVRSGAFEGRSMLESHRLVLAAIAHMMSGDRAPVHAIDSLRTLKS